VRIDQSRVRPMPRNKRNGSQKSRCLTMYGNLPYTFTKVEGEMPAIQKGRKLERIEARVHPEQKSRIEYAASLRGTSVSDFMVQNADEADVRTIREHEVWTLQGRDREIFVETLLNPPAPNARMKAAVARYKKLSA